MRDTVNIKTHMAKQAIRSNNTNTVGRGNKVYYELKDNHVIKVTQIDKQQTLDVLTYREFNDSIELGVDSQDISLPVSAMPLNTSKITIEDDRYVVYHIDLSKPYMPMFKRKYMYVNRVEFKERIRGQKQEIIKCYLTFDTQEREITDVKIFNNEGVSYPALEERAMNLRHLYKDDSRGFIAWSYLMSSVRLDEPELLRIVEGGNSLLTYQGEGSN